MQWDDIGIVEDLQALVERKKDIQRQQRELWQDYAMGFCSKLRPEAALLHPMELKGSDSWDCHTTSGYPGLKE